MARHPIQLGVLVKVTVAKAIIIALAVLLTLTLEWIPLWRGILIFAALLLVTTGVNFYQLNTDSDKSASAAYALTVYALIGVAVLTPMIGHSLFWSATGVVVAAAVSQIVFRRWIPDSESGPQDE